MVISSAKRKELGINNKVRIRERERERERVKLL